MNRQSILFVIFIGFCLPVVAFPEMALDSTGIKKVEGEVFIIHEVEAGETLYALSRRYGVAVELIQQANKEDVAVLNIGQKVLIPSLNPSSDSNDVIHTVKSSETLFSISRNYNVSVDQLKSWNNLSDNNLSLGQKLIIKEQETVDNSSLSVTEVDADRRTHTVKQSETLYSISRMYNISSEELTNFNSLSSSALSVGQVLLLPDVSAEELEAKTSNSSMLPAAVEEVEPSSESNTAENVAATGIVAFTESDAEIAMEPEPTVKPAEKIVQKGMAEVNDQRSETKKYLGLHRDAPIGTIMQVRNEMNNQSVFVRIVGTIPDTGDNAKVILKISQKAYDRLGAVDSRFPVEISYMP